MILAYRPMVNLAVAGISVEAFLNIQVDQRHTDDVVAQLIEMPERLIIDEVAGPSDLLARVATTDHNHLRRFVHSVSEVPHVLRLTTTVVWSRALAYRPEAILMESAQASDFGRSTPAPKHQ